MDGPFNSLRRTHSGDSSTLFTKSAQQTRIKLERYKLVESKKKVAELGSEAEWGSEARIKFEKYKLLESKRRVAEWEKVAEMEKVAKEDSEPHIQLESLERNKLFHSKIKVTEWKTEREALKNMPKLKSLKAQIEDMLERSKTRSSSSQADQDDWYTRYEQNTVKLLEMVQNLEEKEGALAEAAPEFYMKSNCTTGNICL